MDRRLKKSRISALFLLFLCCWGFSSSCLAEYRAYQYFVVPVRQEYYKGNEGFLAISSLDPVSYLAYHGGSSSVAITLLRTWMCPGHTGGSNERGEVCAGPYQKLVESENKTSQENKRESGQ